MRLNQVIALAKGTKSRAASATTKVYHQLQKKELLQGLTRTYRPRYEDGETLPSEVKHVQVTVGDAVSEIKSALSSLFDVVLTQDAANCVAKAPIIVDGMPLADGVPVTYLLFLEKQLVDLHTIITKLPTLDPAFVWKYSGDVGCNVTDPVETVRTKKILRNHIKAEATPHHPAQVELFHEDIVVGYWEAIKFSGAIGEDEKRSILAAVEKLQDAVRVAREEANTTEIQMQKIGGKLLEYVFGV